MKRYICRIGGIVAAALLLAGCNSEIPELTDEQSALITEYATNLLVKHSELSDRSLLSDTNLELGIQIEAEERARKAMADEIAQAYINKDVEKIEGADSSEEGDSWSNGAMEMYGSSQPIGEFFGTGNFTVDYVTSDICDSYPEASDEDFFMAMDATPGKQLCVVKFRVQNVTGSEQEFDMLSQKGRFSLKTGNGDTIQAQSTMLLNDLSSYRGIIGAGADEEMVLVFEVDGSADITGSMSLVMKNDTGENVILLE